jgi:hypothetical protein
MSTPEWVGYIAMVGSIAGVVARMIYVSSGPPDKDCYCPVCKDVTPRHPKNGCTVCHSTDSFI